MTEPRWLAADEQRAWRAFLLMHSRLAARLNRQLQAACGLSLADYEVLVHLSEAAGGRARPHELQRALDWEQSRLSHQLARMRQRGLVTRERCGEDRRGAHVLLTDAGRQAITTAAPGHVETVRRLFFDPLTEDQVAALHTLAGQVLARLDDDGAPGDPEAPRDEAPRDAGGSGRRP
ncbi:MarR family transcriptional regulator [Sphaerisporangium rufum]|uniref:MarR family transcriptional regulator n=1 Tax=Sphaerisporangium rufum TaxID=1381558 RepID=A0A919R1E4_9ACTN|nr:MarR family transcriptional regulator [Sphaerisporangium rufum]GII77976.1 MarR family transcriptional regulator [Sphaerisporangium rufum]